MELIDNKQDTQGMRYHIAGSFKLITEDWQKNKNMPDNKNKAKTEKQTNDLLKNVGFNNLKIYLVLFFVIFVSPNILQAQNTPTDANIFGHVTCCGGHLPLSTITIEGTTIGTTTDNTGHYKLLNLPEGTFTLKV